MVWLLCGFSGGFLAEDGLGPTLRQLVLSAAVGAAVDADHFLSAGSLSLEKATSLPQRPLTHSLTFALAVLLMLLIRMGHRGMMVGVPYVMHVVRDGLRRGLWMWPLGHTYPLSKAAYLSTVFIAAILARSLDRWVNLAQVPEDLEVERAV